MRSIASKFRPQRPEASVNFGKGNGSTRDVTNVETIVAAGGTATVTTPGALTLEGAQLNANAVNVDVGSLSIISQQDSKEIRSKQTGFGLSTKGLPGVDAGLSATGSFNSSSERGNFVSVVEQSGINAGAGGFNINVDGATNLVGGVISSTADPALNQLTTGTLTASDLQNRESYKANSIGLSGSISGVGGKDSSGNKTKTDFSAGTPIVLGASGGQSGVTQSAIAPGTINITSGDAASQNIVTTISRDTSTANAGALIQEFDAARRAEIQEGFAVTTALIQQTSQFFANRAETEKTKREDAERKEAAAINAGAVQLEPDGSPRRDGNGNLIAIDPNNAGLVNAANTARNDANAYSATFGATSPARIIATALSGAAASNVAGGLGDLIQAAAVNVLQSYTANEVKHIADSLAERDGDHIVETPESETVRALLQGLAGCAGGAAGGSADCGSAALGASASVVINLLLNSIEKDFQEARDQEIEYDENGNPVNPLSLEQQQERSNLVASIIGGISSIVGLDAAAAVTAGQIETENNQVTIGKNVQIVAGNPGNLTNEQSNQLWADLFASDAGMLLVEVFGSEAKARECITNNKVPGCMELQAKLDGITGAEAFSNAKKSASMRLEGAISNAHGPEVSGEEILNELLLMGVISPATASLPFAEFASQYTGVLADYITRTGKRPNLIAYGGLVAGGLVAIAAGHLVEQPLPGLTPHTPDPDDDREVFPIDTPQSQLPGYGSTDPVDSSGSETLPIYDEWERLPGFGEGTSVSDDPFLNGTILANVSNDWGSFDENGKPLTIRDPLTGEVRPVAPGEAIHRDHILSANSIRTIPGFDMLTAEQKKEILNAPENIQPLPGYLNCSKGCKSGDAWIEYQKGHVLIDPKYRTELQQKQNENYKLLSERVDMLLGRGS